MVPRPKHLPVEIWMPIASGKTIELMAQYRLQGDGDAHGEKFSTTCARPYQAACLKHGQKKQLGEDVNLGRRRLPGAEPRGGDPPPRSPPTTSASSGSRRSASCVYADEHGRTWGSPGGAGPHAAAQGRRRAEGVVLRSPGRVIDGIKSVAAK